MKFEIRRASNNDEQDLVKVLNDSLEYKRSLGDDSWGEDFFSIDEVRAMLKRSDIYVAVSDGEIVATISLEWSDSRLWGSELGKDDKAVYLHQAAVKSNQRGNRLGEYLITWAGKFAKEQGRVYVRLDCGESAHGLIAYYKGIGFDKVGEGTVEHNGYRATLLQKTIALTD